jgi:UDPglucose 6-dehydrogenase
MALRLIRELRGRADIRAYDPVVGAEEIDLPVKVVADRDEALSGADCLLILTDWDEFAVPGPVALRAMRRPLLIDAVGVVDPARADLGGVRFVQMGRPS